jgi:hypothetical protein
MRNVPAERLASLGERVRPGALAHERLLAVDPALVPLLPLGGLRRGSVISTGGVAATSLALGLAATPSGDGAWVGVVGIPSFGAAAAAELGLAVHRMFLVAAPPVGRWAEVVAAVADGAEIVIATLPSGVRVGDARRVQARLATRGAVLLLSRPGERAGAGLGGFQPDLELTVTDAVWEGIGDGFGRLSARRVVVELAGRRGRAVRHELLVPGPSGRVEPVVALHRTLEGAPDIVPDRVSGDPAPAPAVGAWRRTG